MNARNGNHQLHIFLLKDESREDFDSLPKPMVLATEITENLQVRCTKLSQ